MSGEVRAAAGVDPGRSSALALLVNGKLEACRDIRGDILEQVVAGVQWLAELRSGRFPGLELAIELQYDGGRGKRTFKSLDTLMRRRHEWEILCQLYCVPVVPVWPATWQTQLGTQRNGRTKMLSMRLARKLYGRDMIKNDAQADAALIARWLDQRTAQGAMEFLNGER